MPKRLNTLNPLNRRFDPNRGLIMRLLSLPNNSGGRQWFDVCGLNHGTLTNGPTWASMRRDNSFGAVTFDGSNDYVDLGSPTGLSMPGQMTAACWVNATTLSGIVTLIGSYDGGNEFQYKIEINRTAGKVSFVQGTGGLASIVTGTTTLSTATWYHVAAVRSGSAGSWTVELFVNGVSDGSTSGITTGVPATVQPTAIGRAGAAVIQFFNGSLDDMCLWNRVLPTAELLQLYQDGRAGYLNSLNWLKSKTIRAGVAASGGPFPFFTNRRMRGGLIGMNGGL